MSVIFLTECYGGIVDVISVRAFCSDLGISWQCIFLEVSRDCIMMFISCLRIKNVNDVSDP